MQWKGVGRVWGSAAKAHRPMTGNSRTFCAWSHFLASRNISMWFIQANIWRRLKSLNQIYASLRLALSCNPFSNRVSCFIGRTHTKKTVKTSYAIPSQSVIRCLNTWENIKRIAALSETWSCKMRFNERFNFTSNYMLWTSTTTRVLIRLRIQCTKFSTIIALNDFEANRSFGRLKRLIRNSFCQQRQLINNN